MGTSTSGLKHIASMPGARMNPIEVQVTPARGTIDGYCCDGRSKSFPIRLMLTTVVAPGPRTLRDASDAAYGRSYIFRTHSDQDASKSVEQTLGQNPTMFVSRRRQHLAARAKPGKLQQLMKTTVDENPPSTRQMVRLCGGRA
jgi:hypothetical protein